MAQEPTGVAVGARVAGVEVHLPSRRVPTAELEAWVGPFRPPPGLLHRLTGIAARHVMDADEQASDLAVAAARKVLAATGTSPDEVDLLIFAAASQDLVEPATAHIVAAKLGVSCPVMDVKNACNSVLNGIETADALIATGRYRTVLVACGESPSRAVRRDVASLREFLRALPGYTLSDAGAAVLLTAAETPGILASGFAADSRHWAAGTLATGGSMHPRDPEHTYFTLDAAALKKAFLALGTGILDRTLAGAGLGWDDLAVVGVHQVSLPYLEVFADRAGVPRDKLVVTVAEHGNCAAASLPLQLARARESGRAGPGDLVGLVGLAGGVSLGLIVVRL
ncbi:3-oxoacyl-ACP synthase III family protein [Pseudonocardia sediminis]|uniref:3-oxoacyl-ACP synthase III family protein n=1 Tax=Pseudonocardia sediminis TaxID=1397368 RepID=UPI001F5EFCDB|nr:ketoacyl-ACP synthase III [Pseudonocardia sediminis]